MHTRIQNRDQYKCGAHSTPMITSHHTSATNVDGIMYSDGDCRVHSRKADGTLGRALGAFKEDLAQRLKLLPVRVGTIMLAVKPEQPGFKSCAPRTRKREGGGRLPSKTYDEATDDVSRKISAVKRELGCPAGSTWIWYTGYRARTPPGPLSQLICSRISRCTGVCWD